MTIINRASDDYIEKLSASANALGDKAKVCLLIDGAFLPGIWRQARTLVGSEDFANLFSLNGASDNKVLDLSPFVFAYEPDNEAIRALLDRCSGYPMVCSIVSPEPVLQLAHRLRSWCIVVHAGQRLNLRYADTRRLPDIFEVLSVPQRAAMVGPAYEFKYIGRDGEWHDLQVTASSTQEAEAPHLLTDAQFARLIECAEPDEILNDPVFLRRVPRVAPATAYGMVRHALSLIPPTEGTRAQRVEWCGMHIQRFAETIDVAPISWAEFARSGLDDTY